MAYTRYENIPIVKIKTGKDKGILKRVTKFYRDIPLRDNDITVMIQPGDRFDLLANQYYGDPTMWWYIARANNMKFNNIEVGTFIRIPSTIEFME